MTYVFSSEVDQSKLQTTIILTHLLAFLCTIGAIALEILHIYRILFELHIVMVQCHNPDYVDEHIIIVTRFIKDFG
ncbi:hypothetical protein HanXRQr2_Chr07g0283191 [Helianthus annuus]|uniref:Uncharacterized protein n=1 Tax=Helianthus annuus TaxID=4232 RepID=A0A9K3IJM5_HELAN|nr:hypothetical protein HanXRQr2_Chr07g0283191 [Helianthus annuus]